MARATLTFNSLADVPVALRSLGMVFETDDFTDFIYTYGSNFPSYRLNSDNTQIQYVNGTDAAGFATWTYCLVRIYSGDGGL